MKSMAYHTINSEKAAVLKTLKSFWQHGKGQQKPPASKASSVALAIS
jgi:hypothetical protein